jgi:hypothetical protein
MKAPTECEVCGKAITRRTRCTNGRCLDCHRAHCTPGGVTSPGHSRRWPPEVGVHRQHCCTTHGCKYGEHTTCPVAVGRTAPAAGERLCCMEARTMADDAVDDALEAEALEAACPVCDARPGAPCVNHRSDMGPRGAHGLRLVNARGGA